MLLTGLTNSRVAIATEDMSDSAIGACGRSERVAPENQNLELHTHGQEQHDSRDLRPHAFGLPNHVKNLVKLWYSCASFANAALFLAVSSCSEI